MKSSIRYSLLTVMSLFAFFGLVPASNALEIGSAAPEPVAVDQDGNTISFGDVYRKGITLVFFFPKADTPGCTLEVCSLRDSYADLTAAGVKVIGVSEDKTDSQKAFHDKFKLPYPLITDTDGSVAKAFGVPVVFNFAKRQSFLIKDGKIAWLDKQASTRDQAKDVRDALEDINIQVKPDTRPQPKPFN